MTYEEYRRRYEMLEGEAKAGRRSWESICAQIAMLSIEYGQQQVKMLLEDVPDRESPLKSKR